MHLSAPQKTGLRSVLVPVRVDRNTSIPEGSFSEILSDGIRPTENRMYSAMLTALAWLRTNEWLALWVEGLALVAIFIWDRIDSHQQHDETVKQMEIMQNQARATEMAANAATKSAEALINSERAWVIAELVPEAMRFMDNRWYRFVGDKPVAMSATELLAGHHLRYRLKLTNMGRTPAQIYWLTIRYNCLKQGETDLPINAEGNHVSIRSFEHLLGDGNAIETGESVDVGFYIQEEADAIKALDKTAVIHGTIKYRHMFSTTDDCYADFCYSYKPSEQRLVSVGRYTKQRQEKA